MCIFFTFQHSWTVNFYISHLPLKGKAMATKPRKRIPLRVALLATLVGLLGTVLLFGGRSQASSLTISCDGKGCVECDNSTQECPEPPPPVPTPTPAPSAPAPSPEPPAPTPNPEPSAPAPSPEPPAPTPEPSTPVPTPSVTPEPTPPAPTPSVTPEPPAPTPTPEPPASTPSPEPSTPTTPALGLAKTGASSANLPWITLVLGALGWGAWNKAQQRRV